LISRFETKVGLFTLISLVILISGLLWLNGHQFLDRNYQLEVIFIHVGGLRPGAPVQMAGVDIGRVSRVTLTPEGQVLVVLKLAPEVILKTGALVTINTAGLLGEKIIEIIPGPGPDRIPPGTRLQGKEPFSPEDLFRETGEVMTTLKRITISLDQLLSDQALLDRLRQTTTDLETIAGNLAAFSRKLAMSDPSDLLAALKVITTRLTTLNYDGINAILTAAEDLPVFLAQLNELVGAFEPFQQELNRFLTELRADGRTATAVANILSALEPAAENLAHLSAQLTTGDPNLADLMTATAEMLTSVQMITTGLNQLIEEAATEDSADLFKSSMQKAGRVLNLADDFLKAYESLSLTNQLSLSVTPQEWGVDYEAKLNWKKEQFLLFGWEDLGDQNRFSLQFGVDRNPWQYRLGILHNWLGFGLNYQTRNFSLQADLWQPNQPVLDLYARYQLAPLTLKIGLRNLASPAQHWYAGLGWMF
jgi:phospholipid/cholesterol/gamma-HCH transport system substrate-binding protein